MMAQGQGAVDSLLGRLSSVLLNEAQLLGGLRGDVEFIKDEMESMNGLLRHLTEAQHRDHQVRAWMKQVVSLARDSEGYVELYIRHVKSPAAKPGPGAGNYLLQNMRRLQWLLRTYLPRRQIAKRIKELKVRARDVGDRRQRYGVTVPDVHSGDGDAESPRPPVAVGEEDRRRRALLRVPETLDQAEVVSKGIAHLINKLLTEEDAIHAAAEPRKRVFPVIADWSSTNSSIGNSIARGVYEHPSVEGSFSSRAWVDSATTLRQILLDILQQLNAVRPGLEEANEEDLARKVHDELEGKRFLIVLKDVRYIWSERDTIASALLHPDDCARGSAVIMTTDCSTVANPPFGPSVPGATVENSFAFFFVNATKLAAHFRSDNWSISDFIGHFYPDAVAIKMYLHLLYVDPRNKTLQLEGYHSTIAQHRYQDKNIAQQMALFCYSNMPSKYRSFLLYLTIFPEGHVIRTSSLTRRWIAEGLMTSATTSNGMESSTDKAERYLDALVTLGFLSPVEISAAGNVKSCIVHHDVREVIIRIARDVTFADMNLPPELAQHLTIHNRIGLEESDSDGNSKDIVSFLPTLASSAQWQLFKVLDLEGCIGLKKHHLESICKIVLLKYLSLRKTDIRQLPRQIERLKSLETLDIRQTKIRLLARKPIVLPNLKHFLAGHSKVSARNDAAGAEDSISTVHMPFGIHRMKNLEILSHVQVSKAELVDIGWLLKLRKLGIALSGKNVRLSDLFRQIEKLHSCLRSLSIRNEQPAGQENHDDSGIVDASPTFPQFLESLNISGITSGLPHSIQDNNQLAKLTLSKTYLNRDGLTILGNLPSLCCLMLQHKSYTDTHLSFREDEFQSLNFLLVDSNDITHIVFINGTAPKIDKIVWTFSTMEALSGVHHLPELKKLELNGDCNMDPVREDILRHPKYPYFPDLKHSSNLQHQQD